MRKSNWFGILLFSMALGGTALAAKTPTSFPLRISEHFNRSGNHFETCSVIVETVQGRALIRTDLGSDNRWHLRGGGFKENGYQTGAVWQIESVAADGIRHKTTVTFDSDLQNVIHAQMISTDSSGAVISKYVCVTPLLS